MNDSGAYGSTVSAPSDYHPRLNGGSGRNLGFVADPQKDGWLVGSPAYFGDFFFPGMQQEGFSVQYNNNVYHNWTSGRNDIPGANISLTDDGINKTAIWEGIRDGLKITQKTIVPINEVYFVVRVEFKNTTTETIDGVYYVRTLDPDNEVTLSGDYSTRNEIAYALPNANNNTLVTAKGLSITDCYLGLGTKDCRAKPFIIDSSLWPDPADLISGIHDHTLTGYQYTGETSADEGIGVSFKIGSIAPGETRRIALAYVLKESDLDLALAQTVAQINVESNILINNHNYNFCENQIVNLSIENGDNYEWHWQPEEYFSSPYATNVTLQVPDRPVTFTLSGESDCTPVSYSFTITPDTFQSELNEKYHAICSGGSTSYNPLAAVATPTSTITWYDAPIGGTVIGTTPNFNTGILTNVSATPVEYIYYYEEVTTAGCTSERIPFHVKVYNSLALNNAVLKKCVAGSELTNFDLTEYQNVLEPIANATFSYYTSMFNLTNNIPITTPTNFANTVNNQVIYVKVVVNAGCFDVVELSLIVFPEITTTSASIFGCDNDDDQKMIHDLTSVNSTINSNSDSVFSYYLTQANAEAAINAIATPTAYTNLINPQTIYVRVANANCTSYATLTLNVNTPPVVTAASLTECQKNTDGTPVTSSFNLTSATSQFSTQTLTYSYYTSLANLASGTAISNPTSFVNTSNPQVIFVKAVNEITHCEAQTQLTLIVLPAPKRNMTARECQKNLDGTSNFNLNTVVSGFSTETLTYTFYTSMANFNSDIAISNPTTFVNTSNPQVIYVKALNETTRCFSEIQLTLEVLPAPKRNMTSRECQENLDGTSNFNLNTSLSGFSTETLTYTFYTSMANFNSDIAISNPTTFVNTSNPQVIYVKALNETTRCYSEIELTLEVIPITKQTIAPIFKCDDSFDGFVLFNLGDYATSYAAVLPSDTYTYTYFLSETDAFLNVNAISQSFTNSVSPQTIYVRAQGLSGCAKIVSMDLIVLVKPNLIITEKRILCEGTTITLDAGPGFDQYLWSTTETSQTITVDSPGDYKIKVSNVYGIYSCDTEKTVHVVQSGIAKIEHIEIKDWTDTQNSIIIYTSGTGDYEYSLDNINFQDAPYFENLISDIYTVYVRDKNGCGDTNKGFYVLMYPKYFTPNNDTFNDYWNVKFSNYEPVLKVSIFDRFGKFITTFKGNEKGWDGKLNGENAPATDYWFVVDRKDGKQFKGHFTLKR